MSQTEENLQSFLTQVYVPVDAYFRYKQAHPSWNIIYALGKTKYKDELLHSYFLATLLRTKIDGKPVFLQLFLDLLNQKFNFTCTSQSFAKPTAIQTEYDIGPIQPDYLSGGRIDLLLQGTDDTLVIENKIFAEDQPKQLFRYYRAFPQSKIIYLTRLGQQPSPDSVYQLEEEGGTYYCLSYEQDILRWLKACTDAAACADVPNEPLKMALAQYRQVIENLTGQGEQKEMNDRIIQLATADEKNFISALHIAENFNKIQNEFIRQKLLSPLKQFITAQYGNDFQVQELLRDLPDKPHVISGFAILHPSWKHIKITFNSEDYKGMNALYGISQIPSGKPVLRDTPVFSYFFDKQKFPAYESSWWWPIIGDLGYSLLAEDTFIKLWNPQEQAVILKHFQEKIKEIMQLIRQAQQDGVEV